MIFDRILEDSLGFLRRMLWSKTGKPEACRPPFQSMRTFEGEQGVISLLEGRDTPRAVRTWMYCPKRRELNSAQMVAQSNSMDLHIYCDFLGPLPHARTPRADEERETIANQRQQGKNVPSHRIQIFKASHFLNGDGFYDYELIFWQDRDFYVQGVSDLNKIAQVAVDRLARHCLMLGEPLKLKADDWPEIIDNIWSEVRSEVMSKVAAAS